MRFDVSLEQARGFVESGEVVLVQLKKEGECMRADPEFFSMVYSKKDNTSTITNKYLGIVKINDDGTKYPYVLRVGGSRALCNKGKKLWYCPRCNELGSLPKDSMGLSHVCGTATEFKTGKIIETHWRPLVFVVEEIEEKKLLDVTEEEARKEGFKKTIDFFEEFCKMTKIEHTFDIPGKPMHSFRHSDEKWLSIAENPLVFVIKGKVK